MLVLPLFAALLGAQSAFCLPQQIPLLSPSSGALSTLLSPTSLPLSSLSSTLAQLPLEHLHQLEKHVHGLPEKRIVQLTRDGPQGERREVTEGQKALLTLVGECFIDVTNDVTGALEAYSKNSYPDHLSHNATELAPMFKRISIKEMKGFISHFSSFFNRYYRSQYGRESQQWLLAQLKELHATHNPSASLTFREFKHSSWEQRSIIAHWEPSSRAAQAAPVLILSSHQDSTNSLPFLRAPGADDDGSGTTALVQALTVLLKSGWAPESRPLELHFYSAEEGGLLGSGEVARSYREEGKSVRGMYHQDVVAYVKPGTEPVIGLITDGVDSDLVDYLELLIDEYAEIPAERTQCGYACSDHGSWTRNGFPSSCLAEGKFADSNPNMHSTADIVDRPDGAYSFGHIAQFVRVGVAFAVELAGGKE
ncbi:hypothetical protein JCM10213_000129 [Rhodosporidiobolus nylandii]